MRQQILGSLALGMVLAGCTAQTGEPTNAASPPTASLAASSSDYTRVNELIAEMTLDEKLAQISCIWFDKAKVLGQNGDFDPARMAAEFPHGIGCFARPQDTIGMEDQGEREALNDSSVTRKMSARTPSETVALTNAIQTWHMEQTRLGVPTLFHEEGLHGFQGRYATSFPQAIALAASFDTEMVEEIYAVVAREIRVRGAHHVLSPVVDVALDPRWGRIEETFGEDPYLVSQMGVAAVKGFQGDGFPLADDKVLATLKHMTGHGQPEAGMNVGPAQVSERVLREIFFPPFEAAVDAGAASVMASYNEIDGIPSHANSWLLNDVLRGEWGFDGAVVADYFAINELQGRHRIVDDLGDAGEIALRSGVDIELPDGVAFYALKDRIEAGELDMDYVDQAVRRMLEMKMRANLFETPFADGAAADALTGNEQARELAIEAARKSAVLLKNEGELLPLEAGDYKRIAVIGPNADVTILGGYSDEPRQLVSLLDGLESKLGDGVEIVHEPGVRLTDNRSWWDDEVNLASREENLAGIERAVEVASGADLVILAIGGDESTSREAWNENHMGDRNDITLIGEQVELVEAIAQTGTPMVAVVISGRPLSLANVEDDLPAILYAWLLGQDTGTALADLLFGDANPGGKMPVTIPRNVGQIPAFYNHKPTARRGYAFADVSPLYPFGYGLSYTEFEIGAPRLSQLEIGIDGTSSVSVDVTNVGSRAGDEVVQLYIRDLVSTVTRPVMELKGFERVSLEPGETRTVSFDITPEALRFFDREMKRIVEPGDFEIMVGNSSTSTQSVTLSVR